MRLVARVVVAELDRRGDLKPVAVEDPSDPRPLYLIRGTSRVVDLSPIGMVPTCSAHSVDDRPAVFPVVPSLLDGG